MGNERIRLNAPTKTTHRRRFQRKASKSNIDETSLMSPDNSPHQAMSSHILELQQTIGNKATINLLQQSQSKPVQTKLEVGSPNDRYEHEANQVADAVMQSSTKQVQTKQSGLANFIQRLAGGQNGGDTIGGSKVSPEVESRIQSSRGSGQALEGNTRSHMEQAFGVDFSKVRIHTGTESDKLNRSLQAKAFTTGSDIFFRNGAYNPANKAGQHLLAHELTHTVQQQSGKMNRMPIQRVMDTSGGTWDEKEFKSEMVDGSKPGALMEMHFTPNNLVESKKVALVQKVKKTHNGVNLDAQKKQTEKDGGYMSDGYQTASNRTTDTGDGHWDRALTMTNPVYGAKDLGEGKDISKTEKSSFDMSDTTDPSKRSNYQLGHRYNTWFGAKNNVREAILWDKPNMPSAGDGSEMIFEISALSIEGGQKGTFYGSVEWGFKVTGDKSNPTVNLVGPSIVSQGTPSDNMKELAEVWNNKPTKTGGKSIDNTKMLTTNYTSLANDIDLTDAVAVQQAIDTIELQIKGLKGTDAKNAKFEVKFLKNKLKNLQG